MNAATPSLTEMPDPQFVMSNEGHRIATYTWGDEAADPVLCVHGFSSSCRDNWVATGWVRDLTRAGFRVIGVDQRGHGASDKPHDPRAYTMDALLADLESVLETYLVDEARYVGYSLGARVGWQLAVDASLRVSRAVLGGIPDGTPLGRLKLDQARAFVEDGTEIADKVTRNYGASPRRRRTAPSSRCRGATTSTPRAHATCVRPRWSSFTADRLVSPSPGG